MSFNNNGNNNSNFKPQAYFNIKYPNLKGEVVSLNDSSRLFESKKVDNALLRKHEGLVIAHAAFIAAGGKADDESAPPEGLILGDQKAFDEGVPYTVLMVLQLAGNAEDLDTDDV